MFQDAAWPVDMLHDATYSPALFPIGGMLGTRAVRNEQEDRRSSASNLGEDALRQPRTVENKESDRCTESHHLSMRSHLCRR
jgi:hypothetical protein